MRACLARRVARLWCTGCTCSPARRTTAVAVAVAGWLELSLAVLDGVVAPRCAAPLPSLGCVLSTHLLVAPPHCTVLTAARALSALPELTVRLRWLSTHPTPPMCDMELTLSMHPQHGRFNPRGATDLPPRDGALHCTRSHSIEPKLRHRGIALESSAPRLLGKHRLMIASSDRHG